MFDNREAWLNFVAGELAAVFAATGAKLPKKIRISIGFPSTGSKGKRVGECWDAKASRDGHFEILIRPDYDDPQEVAAVLAHELCHAAAGIPAGHGPAFRKIALAIGLEGKMKSTKAGAELVAALKPILKRAGKLPHARLSLDGLTTKPKKQTSRLIKCECTACGFLARVARKWIVEAGTPVCPTDKAPMIADMPDEDEPDEAPEDE
jgi:hypothetical protein